MTYQEYIQSEEWHAKAEAAKIRAGYRCQVCNGSDRLDAHHRTYERLGQELDMDITILCHPCHHLFSVQAKKIGWFLEPIDYQPIPFEQLFSRKMKELKLDAHE